MILYLRAKGMESAFNKKSIAGDWSLDKRERHGFIPEIKQCANQRP